MLTILSIFLRGHDVQHHFVGNTHTVSTYGRQVVDALVHTVINDAFF